MRGHIKLFTLHMVPQNAQQTAKANKCSFSVDRPGSVSAERLLLQTPQ